MSNSRDIENAAGGAAQLMIATVGSADSSGTTLQFNATAATATKFKKISGQSLSAGDLVLVARVSGSYVIIGKIAN